MTPNWMLRLRRSAFLILALTLLSVAAAPLQASVVSTSDCLPPLDPGSAYTGQYHQYAVAGFGNIILSDPIHSSFTSCTPPPTGSTTHSFGSTVSGDLSVDGVPFGPFLADAATTVSVTFSGMVGATRSFDTEMLQLDISSGGIMIRESPTQNSTGKTAVTDLGPGRYFIESFFDVYTELSLDGGRTWTPSSGPGPGGSTTMTLVTVPEPASLLLVATGLVVIGARMRRRHAASRYPRRVATRARAGLH